MLKSQNWTGSSTPVFHPNSVLVAVGPEVGIVEVGKIMPVALIRPLSATSDPLHGEEPDYLQQDFEITLIVTIDGDRTGQNPIIGAHRASQTSSKGRGILELEEEVFNAVERLNTIDGVICQAVVTGAAQAEMAPDQHGLVYRDYTYRVYTTADRYYHPCRKFVATGGSGQVSMTWSLPPDRYDRYQVILRRASGATAPASATAGTGVTLSGNLATSVTDTIAAGTYSYSLWVAYDETNSTAAQADRYSGEVKQESVVVS